MTAGAAPIGRIAARAYRIPTDAPEADGTFEWDSTVLVVVEIEGGGETGLGYTYSDASIALLIERTLAPVLAGLSALAIAEANAALWRKVRNLGRSGLAATAISALDTALWDLKAKLLGVPSPRCSAVAARACRSMAAAGLPPIRRSVCAASLRAGSSRMAAGGSR